MGCCERRHRTVVDTGLAGAPHRDELPVFCRWLRTVGQRVAGHQWTRGSWVTADPDGLLCGWLDTCPDGYWRASSHLTKADRQRFAARGIDLPPGAIPGTRLNTLLYQPFERGGERRLLLKLETAGARLLPAGRVDCPVIGHRGIGIRDLVETPHHLASGLWRKGWWVTDRRGESFRDLPPAARTATIRFADRLDIRGGGAAPA